MLEALTWLYAGALAAAIAAALLSLTNRSRAARRAGLVGLICAGAGVALISILTRRPPLYGPMESLMNIAFLLGLLGWRGERRFLSGGLVAKRLWPAMALILLPLLFLPRQLNRDFYMYDYPWTLLFFQLRLAAIAFLVYSSVNYAASLEAKEQDGLRTFLLYRGRIFLLLGGALFLGGEFAGSVWCLNWLGDFWRWSRGFFESALMFLVIVMAFHLPPKPAASPRLRAVFGAAPGLLIFGLAMIHQFMG